MNRLLFGVKTNGGPVPLAGMGVSESESWSVRTGPATAVDGGENLIRNDRRRAV